MKFKGQGKINICGFEYKKNIADSRRGGGGSEHPPPLAVSAPGYHIGYEPRFIYSSRHCSGEKGQVD